MKNRFIDVMRFQYFRDIKFNVFLLRPVFLLSGLLLTTSVNARDYDANQDCGIAQDKEGRPMAGIMAIASSDENYKATEFSFTDEQGRFCLPDLHAKLDRISFRSGPEENYSFRVIRSDQNKVKFDLTAKTTGYVQESPASLLSILPEGARKNTFIRACTSCHQLGHDRVFSEGQPRTKSEWLEIIQNMRALDTYGTVDLVESDDLIAEWLENSFNVPFADMASSLPGLLTPDPSFLKNISITEFTIPESWENPHDIAWGPDKQLWITGFLSDSLWVLDPNTADYQRIDLNSDPDVIEEVRALKFDKDGKLWVVKGRTGYAVVYDPVAKKQENIPLGIYAHSIARDQNGDFWVNDYFGPKGGALRLSAKNHQVERFEFVPEDARPNKHLPLTYGLGVDSKGMIWNSQLGANKIISLDPETREVNVIDMPLKASSPRRIVIDNRDNIWIPEYSTGHLAKLLSDGKTFERYKIDVPGVGLYVALFDEARHAIWLGSSLADSLYYFDIKTEKAQRIPLPTDAAYIRHLSLDEETGDLWASYSPHPPETPMVIRVRLTEPESKALRE